MLRWVLGGIAAIVVGIIFVVRYFSGVPAESQLTTLTGQVSGLDLEERRSRRSTSVRLVVRIDDKTPAHYRDRLPDFERIAGSIHKGDRVTMLVDSDNSIWQLEKDGQRLVSYAQVAEAQ